MHERLKQLDLVGRGAMAEVFRGVLTGERGTSRSVALKRLRADLLGDATAVDLFVHEARIALQLSHPNVVHALELVRDEQGYALVCEWLDCASLATLVSELGKLPWQAALYVGKSVCDALHYLHALRGIDGRPRGIVHRDVTPANVLVSASGQVKLGDFGVAWSTVDPPPIAILAAGTPDFSAPEQDQRGALDGRIDVFGLGATLRAVTADPPAALHAAIERACAAAVAGRFADAHALGEALDGVARACGVLIGPDALRAWLDKCGGLPTRPPPRIDAALQSILGGALLSNEATPLTARTRKRRLRAWPWMGAGVGAAAVVTAVTWVLGRQQTPDATPPLVEVPPQIARQVAEPSDTNAVPVPVERPRRIGIVSINAVPWATVIMDGKPAGETPLRALRLTEGRHTLQLVHPPEQLRRDFTIEVGPDQMQTFVIDLRRGTVSKRTGP